jgi:hypothetical protein
MTINRTEILRNYHNQAIVIKLTNSKEALSGMIVDDTPEDYCIFVEDPNLVQYYETREESLMERIYFKDMKIIEYQ